MLSKLGQLELNRLDFILSPEVFDAKANGLQVPDLPSLGTCLDESADFLQGLFILTSKRQEVPEVEDPIEMEPDLIVYAQRSEPELFSRRLHLILQGSHPIMTGKEVADGLSDGEFTHRLVLGGIEEISFSGLVLQLGVLESARIPTTSHKGILFGPEGKEVRVPLPPDAEEIFQRVGFLGVGLLGGGNPGRGILGPGWGLESRGQNRRKDQKKQWRSHPGSCLSTSESG